MARYHDQTVIYEVASVFAQECLLGDGSYFWPGESVWTKENLDLIWSEFAEKPDEGSDSFVVKWSKQLASLPVNGFRLAYEVTALYCLYPSAAQFGTNAKNNLLKDVLTMGPDLGGLDPSREAEFQKAISGFGIGMPGTGYLTNRPFHIALYLAFAKGTKESGASTFEQIDSKSTVTNALELVRETMNHRPAASVNILLHIFWPDEYEGTASADYKKRIAKNLSSRFGLTPLNDVDSTILQARRHMEEVEGFPQDFDMYSEEVRPLWDFAASKPQKKAKPASREPTRTEEEVIPGSVTVTPPTITDLAAATFLEEPFLRDIESLLTHKQQLIFEGPPGSGKTFVAEKFARYFTGTALNDSDPAEQIELVQFHQSYTYEDFLEGIRPRTNDDGQLVYEVVPGIFRTFADRARANSDKKFVLIIDEINRGNVSRILGELMLLLEYRDKSARLPYSQHHLQIPENLYIIGTMNSADRSLSQIDYALRRRFYFVRFLAVEHGKAPVLSGWLHQQDIESETRARILHMFIELNRRLRDHLETDDLQVGHSYFMDARIHEEGYRQQVWKYAVIPLIREYLYHHRERDELLQEYELQTLSTIVQPIADDLSEPIDSMLAEDSGGEYE